MASIVKDSGARKRLQWVDGSGERRTVHLGAMSMMQASAIKVRVEQLLTSHKTNIIDAEAAKWAADLDDDLYDKLAAKGLVALRQRVGSTLEALWTAYLANANVKPQTKVVYAQAQASLVERFGAACVLDSITHLQCCQWRMWMKEKGLAEATIAKRVKVARSVFRAGVKWKMMRENPMEGVKAGVQTNRDRMYFLSRADTEKVLSECPNTEWRAIIALSRYGGLRCPSEHLALSWDDVLWDKGKVIVRSSKTESSAGGGVRHVPLFPELREHLQTLFDEAPEGTVHVITRYRDFRVNMRTMFQRIIERAGLTAWPRLFHAMRGSRATELCETYPQHVVCRWMGHSAAVAAAHYLSVTDDHFARAAGVPAGGDVAATRAGAPGGAAGEPATRNAA